MDFRKVKINIRKQNVTNVNCNETAISSNEILGEELQRKIELNDDFHDNYSCKEEVTDPLEDLHSSELQGDKYSSNILGDSQAKKEEKNINVVTKLEDWVKIETEESEDLDYVASSDVPKLYCNDTATNDNKTLGEEMEYVELNDGFEDKNRCKEETNNDDQLDESFDDPLHLPEFEVENDQQSIRSEAGMKTERLEDEDLHCNHVEEELAYKIEVHDDFNDRKEETNDNSTDNTTSNKLDFMNYCEENTTYKCKICKSSLKSKKTFKAHVSIHNETRRTHKCETCGKSFSSSSNLNVHSLIHSGEKPHSCETCGKRFRVLDNLTKHVMIHTGEKPYACGICQESFRSQSSLKRHRAVHTGEKPHACKTCGKCFAVAYSLKKHTMIHTGQKPHKCDVCERFFRCRPELNNHLTVHSGEKPHKCNVCEKSFRLAAQLNRHAVIHTREKK